jgi:hypothetical protein
MGDPGQDEPRKDDQALEEIRRLFARYRQPRRFGQVAERDEPPEDREQEAAPSDRPAGES